MTEAVAGFSGSSEAITNAQLEWLERVINSVSVVRHGACIVSDAATHRIALDAGKQVMVHPPTDKKKVDPECLKAQRGVVIYPSKPYLRRNKDIVDGSHFLLATPCREEIVRSGTWSTIRYARKKLKPIYRCMPDGQVVPECLPEEVGHLTALMLEGR